MNKEILNKAIELGLEFGENWLMPVDDRIKAVYPALTGDQLVYLNNHVKELRDIGLGLVLGAIKGSQCEQAAFAKLKENEELIKSKIRALSPDISDDNLSKLYSQSIYYSRK